MYEYSMTQWIVGDEELEQSFSRLKKYGYDGIELAAEPYSIDTAEVLGLMEKYNQKCTSLCGIFTPERNLSSKDPSIAQNAVQYLKDSIDFAQKVGARHIIVVPSPVGCMQPEEGSGYDAAWDCAVQNIRKAAEYAKEKNVGLVIEAINRYETYLVNTISKALKMAREIDHVSVGVMADLFHMNLEENDICSTLLKMGKLLRHVHIADNTREAAGLGSTDFKKVLWTLTEMEYKGYLTMEFLPRISNPYAASRVETQSGLMDIYAEQSIKYMKLMERSVKESMKM